MGSLFGICFAIISTAILLLLIILSPSQTVTANSEAEALKSSGHVVEIKTTIPVGALVGGQLDKLNFLALPHLVRIHLRSAKLEGTIPIKISSLSKLSILDLSSNSLTGAIPAQIGALSNLTYLDLSFNSLTAIPIQIGALSNLKYLGLSVNSLTGAVPIQIDALSNLTYLDLSFNSLTGEIPLDIGQLSQLTILDLSHNNLSGVIPFQIGNLPLQQIDLSQNCIQGTINSVFASIGIFGHNEFLLQVDLSHNNLSGVIPRALLKLSTIDLSYNALEVFFGLLFLGGGLFLLKIKAKKSNREPLVTNEGDIFKIWNFNGKIAYEDIVKATQDFEISYCIGTGGYGSVYRAELPNGRVALKKLHRLEGESDIRQVFQE
ncbi:UNVERIFIED_CONTAM: MDIS1-interacting receptor like kinase [Sesamum radiatum]|uniref:MDIS1-interacting receptor like kinase n=1 Tax=Sesamum radiatum TaxID=300843 RepID=A0AAW2QG64_SESRA